MDSQENPNHNDLLSYKEPAQTLGRNLCIPTCLLSFFCYLSFQPNTPIDYNNDYWTILLLSKSLPLRQKLLLKSHWATSLWNYEYFLFLKFYMFLHLFFLSGYKKIYGFFRVCLVKSNSYFFSPKFLYLDNSNDDKNGIQRKWNLIYKWDFISSQLVI